MNLRLSVLAVALACPACSIWSSPRVWVEETQAFDFDAAAVEQLQCDTHNGSIRTRVDPGAGQVGVVAEVRGGGMDTEDAQAALEAIELVREIRAGELVLGWRWLREKSGWGADVSFDVVLPAAVPVRASTHNGGIAITARDSCTVETHNGDVEVGGDVAHVDATSHNGTVSIRAPVERVDAVTHNGDVRLVDTSSGRLDGRIESHNGNVAVEFAEHTDAAVHCSTHNGGIRAAASMREIAAGDGYLVGELGTGVGRFRVTTHNGGIDVRGGR